MHFTHNCVTDAGEHGNANKPKSQVDVGFATDEEKSSDEEGWNVLQVVQVSAADSFDIFVFLDFDVLTIANVFWILEGLLNENVIT